MATQSCAVADGYDRLPAGVAAALVAASEEGTHMTHATASPLAPGQVEAIVRRAVANVKARKGCQCRVSTEVLMNSSGESRLHVWAIVPCRIHMADASPPAESSMAREIEAAANIGIARVRASA